MRPRFQRLSAASFALFGGLDLTTPQIAIKPGALVGASNYEAVSTGGYRRVDGYEPFDGRPKPSAAVYTVLNATSTFDPSVAAGQTITGATSGASGVVCYVDPGRAFVCVTKVSGAYANGENLQVGGVTKGVLLSTISGVSRSLNNTISAAAAAVYMADIGPVPGSGAVLGVVALGSTVYAFRNNAGGTAADLYRSTSGGWSQVALGRRLPFTSGGTYVVKVGDTITGATSGATAVVTGVAVRTGTWNAGDAAGILTFASQTGTFVAENLNVGANLNVATVAGNSAAITLLPGGRYEFDLYNFTGSADTLRIYGCDGVNPAFEFDGTTFIPIATGMATDTPAFIRAHKNHLFLGFRGSLQHSSVGDPYRWSVVVGGASELGVGDSITGIVSVVGGASEAALMVFCRDRTWVLYGNDSTSWNLVPFNPTAGALPYTTQLIGSVVYLDDVGLKTTASSQNFGNFDSATISESIRPLLQQKAGLSVASVVVRLRNQYRIFFSDKSGLTVTFNGDRPVGIMPFTLSHQARCLWNAEIGGVEAVYFGADDGFVYQLNSGRSFAGQAVVAYIRTAFNNCKSPRLRKQFMRAIVEASSEQGATIALQPEFSNGSLEAPSAASSSVSGYGARWDEMAWDEFYWDELDFSPAVVRIPGVGINVSLIINSASAVEMPHTLHAVTLEFQQRRQER